MDMPDYAGAIAYSLDYLKRELSPTMTYHDLWHTEGDLLPGVMRLAMHSGLDEKEMRLLETAAAFHDIGYVETYENHEIAGVRMVAQVLPGFGFPNEEIDLIIGMIMATRLPQSPRTRLEKILADADLDVFGRDDFFPLSEALRQEKGVYEHEFELKPWYELQLYFVKSHEYFTPEAKMLRDEMKERNIWELEERIRGM